MQTTRRLCVSLALASTAVLLSLGASRAQDRAKNGDSSTQLFNGKNLDGWTDAQGRPAKGWVVEDGAMVRKPNSGDIWTKQRYGDFVLDLEFKTKGNSGVFIRTDKPADNVQTGIEIQVDNPSRTPGKHSLGAVYDAQAPSKSTGNRDEWNKMTITAKNNKLAVSLNGEQIIDMDLDRWKDAGKNPDGSANKFTTALKDFKREGHIGFQDHGSDVMYRNVRLRPIK